MTTILIRFPDDVAKRKALAFLLGRYSFKSWATGELILPDYALAVLAREAIPFSVEGPASYERIVTPFRDPRLQGTTEATLRPARYLDYELPG